MPKKGVEPLQGCPYRFLRPTCMPFHHFGEWKQKIYYYKNGGAEEDRTPDPLHAMQVLSQLSYSPKIYLLTFAILEYKIDNVNLKFYAGVAKWQTR